MLVLVRLSWVAVVFVVVSTSSALGLCLFDVCILRHKDQGMCRAAWGRTGCRLSLPETWLFTQSASPSQGPRYIYAVCRLAEDAEGFGCWLLGPPSRNSAHQKPETTQCCQVTKPWLCVAASTVGLLFERHGCKLRHGCYESRRFPTRRTTSTEEDERQALLFSYCSVPCWRKTC